MNSTMIIVVLITISVICASATPINLFGIGGGGSASTAATGGQILAENSANVVQGSAAGIVTNAVQTLSSALSTGVNVVTGTAGLAGGVLSAPINAIELITSGAENAVGGGGDKTTSNETIIL